MNVNDDYYQEFGGNEYYDEDDDFYYGDPYGYGDETQMKAP